MRPSWRQWLMTTASQSALAWAASEAMPADTETIGFDLFDAGLNHDEDLRVEI